VLRLFDGYHNQNNTIMSVSYIKRIEKQHQITKLWRHELVSRSCVSFALAIVEPEGPVFFGASEMEQGVLAVAVAVS